MVNGKPHVSARQLKLDDKGRFIDPALGGAVVTDATGHEQETAIESYAEQKIREHGKKEAIRFVEARAMRIIAELPNPFWKVSIAIKGRTERSSGERR